MNITQILKISKGVPKRATLVLAVLAGLPTAAFAANGTWTNLTSGGLWSDPLNWSGGTVADASGSTADFTTLDITTDNTVHLDSARTLTMLKFGDTVTNTAASWVLDNNGIAGNVLTLAGTTPTITVTITGSTARVDGILSGNNVTFNGPGTLILTTTNTLTGTFTLGSATVTGAGAVRITRADALGAASLGFAGTADKRAHLELDGAGGNIHFTKNFGNTSGYTLRNVAGTNTVTSGMNMFSGAGGTKVASDGGVLILTGAIQAGQNPRTFEISGTSTGSNTVSGLIGPGSGANITSVLKSGTGTWILTNPNTYGSNGGTTSVTGGTLLVNNTSGSGTGTNVVTVSSGATLGGTGRIASPVTYLSGAKAYFTPGSPLTFTNSVTLNNNIVRLNLPTSLAEGTYNLATNMVSGFSGTFAATPVIDSGSLVYAGKAAIVTTANSVTLTVTTPTGLVIVLF